MRTYLILHKRFFWTLASLLVIAAMVISLGAGLTRPVQAAPMQKSAAAEIDPWAYLALERDGQAKVLVILKEQADLSGATALTTKTEKGTYVYQRLTETAARTQGPIRRFLESQRAEFRSYWIQNMFMVTVKDAALLEEIARQPGVARIEFYHEPYLDVMRDDLGPDYPVFGPAAPVGEEKRSSEAIEWNILRVNADDVWSLGITGAGAVIADLDTGVQWDHPALINQYRPQIPGAPTRHDYNWWDGIGGAQVPYDTGNHGTHTMGTIVGDDGGSNQIGVAPGAYWIACPGIGSPNVGPFDCFQFFLAPTKLDGTDPRPDLAPHVISNSWSSAGTDYRPAIQALYQAGIFFSKSAGNTGPACSTITNPGQWPEVTAAAAFAQGDTIASFSSRGPVYDGYDPVLKPDIAAPGVSVRSSIPGGGYGSMSGTSMACPHVTGAVALLISANPALAGRIDAIQMLLKLGAEPKIDAQCSPFVDHPNDVWGWGILDILASVTLGQTMTFGTLQGQVLDSSNNNPIPGATLSFQDTTTQWVYYSVADNSGNYGRDLPAGTYHVSASQYGYLPGTVSDVVVPSGGTATQDVELNPAPIWTVTGTITDSEGGSVLEATIVFEDTPVIAHADRNTGQYTANVAEGQYWMTVISAGHARSYRQVTIDQNLIEDFALQPVDNYYMRRSVDGACGMAFEWIDATGGTPHPLGDDANAFVSLPSGRSFEFYGNTYTGLYVVSNGLIVFGPPTTSWSGPIPNPAAPNNGIYAFSTDLNPANGSQGQIYSYYYNNRYFVVEWFQVQHYPSGDPETFEIVLDLDTGMILIQYQTVSDPTGVVSGVENAAGTEATQYAYNDPVLIADGMAVAFYPAYGTPPPTGGVGNLAGTVTDAQSSLPILGATVYATAYTTGDVFSFTTDISGTYGAALCADWYSLSAMAEDYEPVIDVSATVYSGEQTIQDFVLQPVLAPGIVISPTALSVAQLPDEITQVNLEIGNVGDADLTFALGEAVDWLAVTPLTGTVAVAETLVVTATFDSTGLEPGIYTTTLEVASNDPLQPLIQVPITLTVECELVHDVDFTWAPVTPTVGEVVAFSATALGTSPFTYTWEVSDGGVGSGEVFNHTFSAAGTYTVTLTVNNCAGVPATVSYVINVMPGEYRTFLPMLKKN